MTEKERVEKATMGPEPLRTSEQLQMMQVFDELIQNKDRNPGDIVWSRDWKMWLIDHARAFRTGEELANVDELKRCDAGVPAAFAATAREGADRCHEDRADVVRARGATGTPRSDREALRRADSVGWRVERLLRRGALGQDPRLVGRGPDPRRVRRCHGAGGEAVPV
jgi:hypothetical protein